MNTMRNWKEPGILYQLTLPALNVVVAKMNMKLSKA
jgi:hypothetical protein